MKLELTKLLLYSAAFFVSITVCFAFFSYVASLKPDQLVSNAYLTGNLGSLSMTVAIIFDLEVVYLGRRNPTFWLRANTAKKLWLTTCMIKVVSATYWNFADMKLQAGMNLLICLIAWGMYHGHLALLAHKPSS